MSINQSYENFELYHEVAAGNESAFRELFQRYVPRLHAMILRITHSTAVTDDLIQEAFLKVWVARDQLTGLAQPGSWIMKIGFHLAVNYVRRQTVRQKVMQDIAASGSEEARQQSGEEQADFRQLLEIVAGAVRGLPEKQRKIYQLSREKGLTISEIAEETGLAVSTVKNLMVMALKYIRTALQQAGYSMILAFWFIV